MYLFYFRSIWSNVYNFCLYSPTPYTVYLIPYDIDRISYTWYVISITNTLTPIFTLVPVQLCSVQRILRRLEESDMLYIVPSGANDDWYWIYATVNANRKNAAYVVRVYMLSFSSIFFVHLFLLFVCFYLTFPNLFTFSSLYLLSTFSKLSAILFCTLQLIYAWSVLAHWWQWSQTLPL